MTPRPHRPKMCIGWLDEFSKISKRVLQTVCMEDADFFRKKIHHSTNTQIFFPDEQWFPGSHPTVSRPVQVEKSRNGHRDEKGSRSAQKCFVEESRCQTDLTAIQTCHPLKRFVPLWRKKYAKGAPEAFKTTAIILFSSYSALLKEEVMHSVGNMPSFLETCRWHQIKTELIVFNKLSI